MVMRKLWMIGLAVFFAVSVAAMAEDPTALRKAFVTMEVLGAPVAMRKDNSVMRFWEQ